MFPFLARPDSQQRQRKGHGRLAAQWGARLVGRCRQTPGSDSEESYHKESNPRESSTKKSNPEQIDSKECVTVPHSTKLKNHVDYHTGLSRLCFTCNQLRYQLAAIDFPPQTPCAPPSFYWPQEFHHHGSFEDFRKAAEEFNCHICYILYYKLPRKLKDRWRPGSAFRMTWEAHQGLGEGGNRTSIYLHFYYCGSFGKVQALSNGMKIAHWEEGDFDVDVKTYYEPGVESSSTSSENTLRLCNRWLQNCLDSHTECTLQSADQRFPARLVEVGSDGDPLIRLYAPKDLADAQPYCTLSHRWGNSRILSLTKETHNNFVENGILISSLPKTFRDAIHVTRSLGTRYLWIDSLCIFQDSVEDWKSQGSIMDIIYANGLCNIAANAGRDSHAGLFQVRDPNWLRPAVIEIPWRSRGSYAPVLKYFIWHTDYWDEEINNATLYTRGWVAQERLLSMRILHFGSSQVHWECVRLQASESFPRSYPFQSYTFSALNKSLARAFHTERIGVSKYDVYSAWESFVVAYSRCELTKDEDVLAAIQGIAHSIQQALGFSGKHDYMLGLWHKRFLESATWYTLAHSGEHAERPRPTRAPTWTWASIKGPIHFCNTSAFSSNRILFFKVAASDIDLDVGQITLRDVHLQQCEWAATAVATPEPRVDFVIKLSLGGQIMSIDAKLDESQLIEQCLKVNNTMRKLCIHVLVTILDENYLSWNIEGLLLRQVDRPGTNEFERVGSFGTKNATFDGKSIRDSWLDERGRSQAFGPARTILLV